MRKNEQSRLYAPDFVDASTLAYRLCCSERLLKDYVKAGVLPKPMKIGNLIRWPWQAVVRHIEDQNGLGDSSARDEQDACAAAIDKARQAREKANSRTA